MHRKVAVALVALLALALGLASCGESQRTETVSRAQVVRRLEAACIASEREARRGWQLKDGRVAFIKAQIVEMKFIRSQLEHLDSTGRAKANLDAYKATLAPRIAAAERIASADRADVSEALRAANPELEADIRRAHAAIVGLGARHICI